MKKIIAVLLLICMVSGLSACGEAEFNIDGKYITDVAYGMQDFYSEIVIEGDKLTLTIEHYGEVVEENSGLITMEENKVNLIGSNGDQEFVYDEEEKTLHNEMMETTWTIEELFVPKDGKPAEENKTEETEKEDEAEGTDPDPIPDEIMGEYKYSDEIKDLTLTIGPNNYRLYATAEGVEPLEVEGAAAFAGTQLFLLEGEHTITCPIDAEKGTIEYEGYTFKKQ